MFITKKAPIQFKTGDIFSPEAINENILFVKKAIAEKANEEVHRWTSTYSFNPDVVTVLDNSTPTYWLERGIPKKTARGKQSGGADIVIESIALTAYYTATTPFSLTVNGTTSKTIEIPVRDTSLATVPFDLVELANITHTDQDPFLVLSAPGGGALPAGVTITKFDVTVGFASNKYAAGNRTSPTSAASCSKPDLDNVIYEWDMNDDTALDANLFNGIETGLETLATDAMKGTPVRWGMVEYTNITTTPPNKWYKPIPAFNKATFATQETRPRRCSIVVEGYTSGTVDITYGLATFNGGNISGSFQNQTGVSGDFYFEYQLPSSGCAETPAGSTANDKTTDQYFKLETNGFIQRATLYIVYQ
jgi:hypothetical protein